MKQLLFILCGIFLISFVSASCTDSFVEGQNVTLCGYCFYQNSSPCPSYHNCTFTLSYSNATLMLNYSLGNNTGNGEITYNLSNLSNGIYEGELDCGPFAKDSFSITVVSTEDISTGSGSYTYQETINVPYTLTENKSIPGDIQKYFDLSVDTLTAKYKKIGKIIVLCILALIVFSPEINVIRNKVKIKSVLGGKNG